MVFLLILGGWRWEMGLLISSHLCPVPTVYVKRKNGSDFYKRNWSRCEKAKKTNDFSENIPSVSGIWNKGRNWFFWEEILSKIVSGIGNVVIYACSDASDF